MISTIVTFRIRSEQFNDLWDLTAQSINGIVETADQPFELIVIDNGSHDARYVTALDTSFKVWVEMPHFRRYLVGARQLRFERQVNLAKAWNVGLNQADGDYILLANNDIVYHEAWMSRLLEPFAWPDRKVGIVGIQHMSWYFAAFVEGSLFVFPASFREQFDLRQNGEYTDRDYPVVFDEQFMLSCEDVDFNLRVQQAGYETLQVNDPPLQPRFLQHLGHRTINTLVGSDENYHELSHGSRVLLCHKYGYPEKITD